MRSSELVSAFMNAAVLLPLVVVSLEQIARVLAYPPTDRLVGRLTYRSLHVAVRDWLLEA